MANPVSLVSSNDSFAIVNLNDVRALSRLGIDDLKPFHSRLVFVKCDSLQFADCISLRSLPVSRIVVENNCFNTSGAMPFSCEGELSLSRDSLCNLVEETYEIEMTSRMPFLSLEEKNDTVKAILNNFESNRFFVTGDKNKISSLTVLKEYEFDGVPKSLIAWVWINKDLSLNARIAEQQKIKNWLNVSKKSTLLASIHLQNKRSLSLFQRWSYHPKYIGVKI